LDEARPWLERALATAQSAGQQAYHDRIQASWGSWLLASGRPEEALALVTQVLSLAQPAAYAPPAQATLIRLHDVAYRAAQALGRADDAFQHLLAYERAERRRTLYELRALGDLFVTRGEALGLLVKAQQAEHRATHDALTGLSNRLQLTLQSGSLRPDDALALIDIDHFKQINDRFGHAAGDAVLVALGKLLMEFGRGHDLAVRLGGEEFVLLLKGGGSTTAQAVAVAERFRQRVAHQTAWPSLPDDLRVTVSIGVAVVGGAPLEQVLQSADAALYQAKRAGRNCVVAAATPAGG
jgi:diguanylate cyclase (GGDEF)-like protein